MNDTRLTIIMLLVACAGLLLWWPLSLMLAMFAALSGRTFFAVIFGLLCDLVYGVPPAGALHTIMFPFTLCAVACVLVRRAAALYLRK